jgi:hypothetical protein
VNGRTVRRETKYIADYQRLLATGRVSLERNSDEELEWHAALIAYGRSDGLNVVTDALTWDCERVAWAELGNPLGSLLRYEGPEQIEAALLESWGDRLLAARARCASTH